MVRYVRRSRKGTYRAKRWGYRARRGTHGTAITRVRNWMPNQLSIRRNKLQMGGIVQIQTNDVLGTYSFKLSDLTNYAELTALFDAYKFVGVKVRFLPQFNMQALATPVTGVVVPKLFVIIDKNDDTAAANINEMREYPNVKVIRGFKSYSVYLKPAMSLGTLSGGTYSASTITSPRWIATSNPSVVHYGIKYAVDAGATGQTSLQKWDVEMTYYLKFKNPK